MTSPVVSLRGEPIWSGTPNTDLVEHLEQLLEQARSGEIGGVILVREWRDRAVTWSRSGTMSVQNAVGAIEAAKFELLTRARE